jgi:ammonia channel protein AmtB
MNSATIPFIALGLFFLIVGVFLFNVVSAENERQLKCEAAGGIFFAPRSGSICLKKDSVIKL